MNRSTPQPKHVLVTGAAGFLGSTVCERLLQQGVQVTGIDNFDRFYAREAKEQNLVGLRTQSAFTFHEIDIRFKKALETLDWRNFDGIIHLAALAGVRPSIRQPKRYYETNVTGTQNILDCVVASDHRPRFVFGSSSSIYGDHPSLVRFDEDKHHINPISPYSETKAIGEVLCRDYHQRYALPMHCLRFFSVYGPRQRPDLMVAKFCQLIQSGKPITLYGDGSTHRDYTYVDDIVSGILLSLDRLASHPTYDVFNLGYGEPVVLKDAVNVLQAELGRSAIIQYLERQAGDVTGTYASIEKAKRLLGYQPKTPFELGVRQYLGHQLGRMQLGPPTTNSTLS